jgi:hypothetical protein
MGFGFASWAARIPQVRDGLNLSAAGLGLLLLAIAVGALVSLPFAGSVVGLLGVPRTVTVMALVSASGLSTAGVGSRVGAPVVAAGLALLGAGNGAWLVAGNVEGTAIERRLGRAMLPRFHASYSIGTVTGALIGAGFVLLNVSVTVHLIAVALAIALVAPLASRHLISAEPERVSDARPVRPLAAWFEPRALLLGLCVFCAAFIEGAGNDWIGVSVVDGYHAKAVVGSLALALFLAAMTGGRWFGTVFVDRFGREASLRVSAGLACGGVLLTVFGSWLPLAMAAVAVWGAGAALGLPLGMSAAADDPIRAAGRVGVVTSIGWIAFLVAPPAIGFLGSRVGTLHALVAVAAFAAFAFALASLVRSQAR